MAFEAAAIIKPAFGDIPTTEVPLFKVSNKEITSFVGGVNITLTFQNYGYKAESGTVWIPWEKVWYGTTLSGSPPHGNITEAFLPFDINGDDDTSDIFTVEYVNNATALVNETTVYAMYIPEQRIFYGEGVYDVLEKNYFTTGLKNHTLYRVSYEPAYDSGYAGFGLESFFRDHPSPNIEFIIEHVGESINSVAIAEITNMELNGTTIPYEFNRVSPWLDYLGWYVDNVYVYSLDPLGNGAVFTVKITIMGDSGAYLFYAIINWSPDNLHRYRFFVSEAVDVPFAITGTACREITFESETYYVDILTNSTVSSAITFNPTAKEISFNSTIYSEYDKPAIYFWNISIPKNLLTDNPWTISIDNETIHSFISTTNGTHTFLYFTYAYNEGWFKTSKISIKGTWAVPEVAPNILMPFFIITTLLASTLHRRKQRNLN
ncbi:MAG: hypothetical protein QXJ31_04585 [Candidatus Bathyarchaeia archaeon]